MNKKHITEGLLSRWLSIALVLLLSTVQGCGGEGGDSINRTGVTNTSSAGLQWIAFSRFSNSQSDLFIIKEDGSNLIRLTNSPEYTETFSAGIAASGQVIFERRHRNVIGMDIDLYRINIDGTNLLNLTNSPDYHESFEGISPAGWLVFSRSGIYNTNPHHLYSVNIDGTHLQTISNGNGNLTEFFGGITPDGHVILEKVLIFNDNRDLYSNQTAIADSVYYDERFGGITPSGRVIFVQWPMQTGGNADLYSINADGTDLITLANSKDHEYFNGVTLNGRIVITSRYSAEKSGLHSINLDGTDRIILTNSASEELFNGITRSGRVIFSWKTNGRMRDISSINADGTGMVNLTNSPDYDEFFLDITSSGRVIFARLVDGVYRGFYSVNADGSDLITFALAGNLSTLPGYAGYMGVTTSGRAILRLWNNLYSINAENGLGLTPLTDVNGIDLFGESVLFGGIF